MFTGIVEEIGTVRMVTESGGSVVVEIGAKRVLEGTAIGDSIAVNGVCLTVVAVGADRFRADVMPETMRRSNLARLHSGDRVNLERAMRADGRFGGHVVSGHIDGTAQILSISREGNAIWLSISAEEHLMRYIVEKGSVALDGVSLTVASVSRGGFKVSVIPHTQEETTLTSKRPGDSINVENDIFARYIEKFMQEGVSSGADGVASGSADDFVSSTAGKGSAESAEGRGSLTLEYLEANGF